MKSIKTIALFFAATLFAGMAVSCDNDDDKQVVVPTEVAKEMPGTYKSEMTFDASKADSLCSLVFAEKSVSYNLPASNIIKTVVDKAQQETALKGYASAAISTTYAATAYASDKVTMAVAAKEGMITYKNGDKTVTIAVATSNPTLVYDAKAKTMQMEYTVKSVTVDGKAVSGFKAKTVKTTATAKQK